MLIDVNSDPLLQAALLRTHLRSPQHARHCNNSNCCHLRVLVLSTVKLTHYIILHIFLSLKNGSKYFVLISDMMHLAHGADFYLWKCSHAAIQHVSCQCQLAYRLRWLPMSLKDSEQRRFSIKDFIMNDF